MGTKIPPAGGLSGDLLTSEVRAAASILPSINTWKRFDIGAIPVGTVTPPTTGDSASEGGGIKANSAVANTYLTQSLFQTPKTGKWWLTGVCALGGGGASGHDTQFGIINGAGTHSWTVQRRNVTSSTKYGVVLIGTSSQFSSAGSVTADNNKHTFRLVFDGTVLSSYVDGVLDIQFSTIAQMADEPMYAQIYSTVAGEALITDLVVGYVGP